MTGDSLNFFDITTIQPDCTILILGDSDSFTNESKTKLLHNLLCCTWAKEIPFNRRITFSNNSKEKACADKPPLYARNRVWQDWSKDRHHLQHFLSKQIKRSRSLAASVSASSSPSTWKQDKYNKSGIVIIENYSDLCRGRPGSHRHPEFDRLLLNGRHLNTSLIITDDTPMSLSPQQRSCIEYVFCLPVHKTRIDKVYQQYFSGVFSSPKLFNEALQCENGNKGSNDNNGIYGLVIRLSRSSEQVYRFKV